MNLIGRSSWVGAAFISAAVLASACTSPAPSRTAEAPAIGVSTARAADTNLATGFEAGGVVRARATASVASRVMAPIAEVRVRPGDRVRRGDVLVTLDALEIVANRARATAALASAVDAARASESDVRAAESNLTLARATHERVKGLHDKRSATAQELDQAVAALDAADAQLAGVRARAASASSAREAAQAAKDAATVAASYATITAPFEGLVTDRLLDPGAMAAPGTPLLTLEDTTAFRLEVPLDEARAAQVRVGSAADVRIGNPGDDSPDWRPARVIEVARIDPASHSFLVKIDLPREADLRSGLFGKARFAGAPRRALTVPRSAVVRRGQLAFVFTVTDDSRARLQPISIGAGGDSQVEVLAGIREGDTAITNPPATLTDGARVRGARP